MQDEPQTQVTQLLQAFGDRPDAADALLPHVYGQLRAIAQRRMSGERRDHTWQATELVHEAYVRLIGDRQLGWRDRRHFYAAAAESMRRILIDYARQRGSRKRGGGKRSAPVNLLELAADPEPEEILALDEALDRLKLEDPRAAATIELRFFAGLSAEEAAEVLDISPRTLGREWAYARARLCQMLTESDGDVRTD